MGERCQPVSGMRNALDYSEEQGLEQDWCTREWFIVNKAEIQITKGSVMVPRAEMGVEARETFKSETGLQDVPIRGPTTFKDEDQAMMRKLFGPHLSDRREDCELFVPPSTSLGHVQKLRALLKEEASVREQRKGHFLSADFEPRGASLFFPGWKLTVAVAGA